MLSVLHIENVAIIKKVDVNFEEGFNVLTGETGAGKSVIIDAIGAILGVRAGKDLIRNGSNKGLVSAIFTGVSHKVREIVYELGAEDEDASCLHIQRELMQNGKSVCRINACPVPTSALKRLAPHLINVHGQHDGQQLLNSDYHINYLDDFCDNSFVLQEFVCVYSELLSIKRQIRKIEKNAQSANEQIEMLQSDIEEIEQANLIIGEDDELADLKRRIQNAQRIDECLNMSYQLMYGSDEYDSAYTQVCVATNKLFDIGDVSPDVKMLCDKAESIKYSIDEFCADLYVQIEHNRYQHQELPSIEERLDVIYKLKRKYSKTIEQILEYKEESAALLEELCKQRHDKQKYQKQYEEKLQIAKQMSKRLTLARQDGAKRLERLVIEQLSQLDMARNVFKVEVKTQKILTDKGCDRVEFLISTNPGEPLKPLAKIASGGELSRIMLAIKNVLPGVDIVDTMIFDEIDTGVSGRAAQKIGQKMWEISKRCQVICVTHLAQIACMADAHFLIEKYQTDDETHTDVVRIKGNERIDEISRIIEGDNPTDTSRKAAGEFIDRGNAFKIWSIDNENI